MIKSRGVPPCPMRLGYSYDRNLNRYEWALGPNSYYLNEVTDTSNHPGWKSSSDGGGYFDHQLTEYRVHPSQSVRVSAIAGGGNPFLSYTGSFACSPLSNSMPLGDGTQWGAIAYQRMKPTKQPYSLLNMVYELKDLGGMFRELQHFWSFSLHPREIGQRFLGQVFGWNPLIGDVMTLIEKYNDVQKRIDWLIRNQGKWVKRRITLTDNITNTTSDWVSDYGCLTPILTTQHYITVPSYRDTTWTRDRIWATAEFRYFLPEVPPGVDLRKVLKRNLQGFRGASMADIYRAIPWSWFVDWIFNFATVLENCDPGVADRLAARRFYIMREQEVVKVRHAKAVMRGYGGGPDVPIDCSSWSRCLHQTRAVGLPFYPGNPNDLSGMQLAILGALGASRL
nr:MAG: hypothetical protein 1 [Leviviridae sp.]